MEQQLTNKHFFFCYDQILADRLINSGFKFVTKAKEPRQLKTFTLFHKTELLETELRKYNQEKALVKNC